MTKALVIALLSWLVGCATSGKTAEGAQSMEGCHTPLGFIPEGRTANGYLRQRPLGGESCQQGTLSCEGGIWTGPYIYSSCIP